MRRQDPKDKPSAPPIEDGTQQMAAVMRAARKGAGLSQIDASRAIGVSQGSLSKMENGLLVPDIFVWMRFCTLTDIPERACVRGYIDWRGPAQPLTLQSRSRIGRFRLPERYATAQGSSVRESNGLLGYARATLTSRENEDFHAMLAVDPDYFVDLRNQISIQYPFDALSLLLRAGKLHERDLGLFMTCAMREESHGAFHEVYRNLPAGNRRSIEILESFARNFPAYDCNYELSLQLRRNGNAEVTLKPAEHMSEIRSDAAILEFLPHYWERFFERLVSEFSGGAARAKARASSLKSGVDPCVIQIAI